ncbi:MAG: 4-(cytidine 5'-diphospho)-2-C-methyl-D-erythritol kinase [Lentisphaeria bacterium]|nr:4-(cytidine 5'-diphospho)-2-C-methyl-D-erythritol kinase [Lentisphaeria bacterium]
MKVPGKINLYLKITRRCPDGYHEISSLFLPLSAPADDVTWHPDAGDGIRLVSDFAADGENLMCRAAARYAARAGLTPTWRFTLDKHIPVAAGMGGGSADAAAVLRLLNEHYRALTPAALSALAAEIGADVPFFLTGVPAVATGIGDRLEPLAAVPPVPVVLVNPRFPVSARWAYRALEPDRIGPDDSGRLERLLTALRQGDPAGVAAELYNDLAPALYRKFPLLRELRDFLRANGGLNAEITGSGSTIYAIAASIDDAAALADRVKHRYGDTMLVYPALAGAV